MIEYEDKAGEVELTEFNSPSPKNPANNSDEVNPILLQPVQRSDVSP